MARRTFALRIAGLLLIHSFALCQTQPLRVAVAANAQFVMEPLRAAFQQQTGIGIEPITGSSGKLTAQIQQGAPFDLFLSADMEFPVALYQNNLTLGAPVLYAYGTLVLWTGPFRGRPIQLAELPDKSVRRIAIANAATAPYGEAALAVLHHYKLYEKVQAKLIFAESIGQVNQYIQTGAADVGFTAKSVVLAPGNRHRGYWRQMPTESHQPIAQGAVVLARTSRPAEARRFLLFLKTPTARLILLRYGYRLP
jgi:molybdate transport system substrate-binding protein